MGETTTKRAEKTDEETILKELVSFPLIFVFFILTLYKNITYKDLNK